MKTKLFTINSLYYTNYIMQKFIIPKTRILSSKISLTGQNAKHILKVLRKKKGDQIFITDGEGTDYNSIITNTTTDVIEIKIIDKFESVTESSIDITLCSGMLKNKKMDFIIKHVTQLGIQKWIPFFCKRSIPVPDKKKINTRKQRWKTIAKESLKQCNRSCLPQISEPVDFKTLMDQSKPPDLKIVFYEKSDQTIQTLRNTFSPEKIIILIGPEGGFSEDEILTAKQKGFVSIGLGPRILRSETASITSCTLIQHIFGDI